MMKFPLSLKAFLVGSVLVFMLSSSLEVAMAATLTVSTSATNSSPSSSATTSATLQSSLNDAKDTLLKSLEDTLESVQKLYTGKVQELVESPLFRAVECLGFLDAKQGSIDLKTMKSEYQKAILEKYVELSADITRLTVGLSTNEQVLQEAISDFQRSFSAKFIMAETTYVDQYQQLQAAYTKAYEQNKALIESLALKLQKVMAVQEKYTAFQQAQTALYNTVVEKSELFKTLQLSKYSLVIAVEKEFDVQIARYQTSNPEISVSKLNAKKENLLAELKREADVQIDTLLKSEIKTSTYLDTLTAVAEFLSQYTLENSYQCSVLISSATDWDKGYENLASRVDTLVQGLKKATETVAALDEEQIKSLETSSIATFQTFSTKILSTNKSTFRSYVMDLISEAYYASQGTSPETEPVETPTPVVSWTPYTFTKSYPKGTYAVELKYLQEFLTAQKLYDGAINGVYDTKTIEAVYQYQLQEGVVTGKEVNKSAYGWMGPATRNAVNRKMNP
jgi:peptidoglycan hydrolase-like protein with peptidoglycan-binding domain